MKLPQVLLSEGVSWRTWLEVEGGRNCPLEEDEAQWQWLSGEATCKWTAQLGSRHDLLPSLRTRASWLPSLELNSVSPSVERGY